MRHAIFLPFLLVALFLQPAIAAEDGLAGFHLLVVQGEREVSLSYDDLLALPQHKLRSSTLYTDGVPEFEGPLLADVVARAGFTGTRLVASAINDYVADIPMSDLTEYGVLAALRMDGQLLSVRDKGPIWIVYPRDDFAELRDGDEEYRWVWQLVRLDVE